MKILSLAAAVALAAAEASAQVPAGPEFQVNTYTTDSQYRASVAVRSDGSFLVVWDSMRQDGSWLGVYGQRYAATGAPVGLEFQVNTYTTDFQWGCQAAALSGGGEVVAFFSDQPPAGIYARVYDASHAPRGPEFQVHASTTDGGVHPAVAADGRDRFVVSWEAQGDGSSNGIFARRFDGTGAPLGPPFQVNTQTTGSQSGPGLAVSPSGDFSVFWNGVGTDADGGIFGQRYDGAGNTRGGEFQVNSYTTNLQYGPQAAADGGGDVVVTWGSVGQDGSGWGVFGQRYDAGGAPLGNEFQVNTGTSGRQAVVAVASDQSFNFVVVWESGDYAVALRGRRYDALGAPRTGEFAVGAPTFQQLYPAVASDAYGNLLAAWYDTVPGETYAQRYGWVFPGSLVVDPASLPGSDGNGVFEPCETGTEVRTSWTNLNGLSQVLGGVASGFFGPPGPTYQLSDPVASYGTIGNGATVSCGATGDCYAIGLPCPLARPARHWDSWLLENLTPVAFGNSQRWLIHVGESFGDVPRDSPFYRFVEILLHHDVTAGCGPDSYCPASSTLREQMAVFTLVAKAGANYSPPACTTPVFADVPASSPYCRWIEELARRGVVGGCGGGNYCPGDAVSREQMAVFALATLDPALDPPACTTPAFGDVPASSPYCRWIEELVRRGVVAGCGGGNYCPSDPVTREQMAVFIAATFGLALY